MARLGIPPHLADRSETSLHFGYQKYKAFLQANQKLQDLSASGEWEGKKPSRTDIIEIFQSRSMWHSHHSKIFSRVSSYPIMVSWLERESNALSDVEVWGFDKTGHGFRDLVTWLDEKDMEREGGVNMDMNMERKGKGKEKSRKGKEKEQEKKEKKKNVGGSKKTKNVK
jgi:hypothetical protein